MDKRVRVICEELKRLKVRQSFVIDSWKYREGFFVRPRMRRSLTARRPGRNRQIPGRMEALI